MPDINLNNVAKNSDLQDLCFNHLSKDRVLFSSNPSGWDEVFREIGNTVRIDENTLVMCYTGTTLPYTQGVSEFVGIAVSTDNGATWTKEGAGGDGKAITDPTEDPYLVYNGGTYYLYCEKKVTTGSGSDDIVLYTSTDRLSWTNQGKVIEKSSDLFEDLDVSSPVVYLNDSGDWFMLYEGRSIVGNEGVVCLATSNDGVTWSKYSSNPVLYGHEWANTDGIDPNLLWGQRVVPDDIKKVGDKFHFTTHVYNGNTFVCGSFETTDFINFNDLLNTYMTRWDNTDNTGDGVMFYNNTQATVLSPDFTELTLCHLTFNPYVSDKFMSITQASGIQALISTNRNEFIHAPITADRTFIFTNSLFNSKGVTKTIHNDSEYFLTIQLDGITVDGSSSDVVVSPHETVKFIGTGIGAWNKILISNRKTTLTLTSLSSTPVTGTTVYFGNLAQRPTTSNALYNIRLNEGKTLKRIFIRAYANGSPSNEDISVYVTKVGVGDNLIATLPTVGGVIEFIKKDFQVYFEENSQFYIKVVYPTWVTVPDSIYWSGYIEFE